MENPLCRLYDVLDADETLTLRASAPDDTWRIYERSGPTSPFYWCSVRLPGYMRRDLFGARGFDSLSAASDWVRRPTSREEVVNLVWYALEDRGLLLDDIRNDVADAGFLPDDENDAWLVEPRHQVKRLIEAHRGLRTMFQDLQATNQELLTDIEELQRSLRNKDIAHGEKLSAYADKLGAYAKEIEKQKDKAGILLIALLSITAMNIVHIFR
jgi:hypothetical protein